VLAFDPDPYGEEHPVAGQLPAVRTGKGMAGVQVRIVHSSRPVGPRGSRDRREINLSPWASKTDRANVEALYAGWVSVVAAPRDRGSRGRRRIPWSRFLAGCLAGAAGLAITFLLRILGLGVFLPELAVEFAVGRIPAEIESIFIRTMGEGAKLLALATALAVFVALPGVYALFFPWIQVRLRNRWLVLGGYALGSALIALVVIVPLLGGGFFGVATYEGPAAAAFSQLLGGWVFAAVLDYLLVEVAAKRPEGFSLSRRQFIAASIALVSGAALALYGFGSFVARPARLAFASVAEMVSKEVTPNEEFYIVTKNLIDPTVDAGSWRLDVDGLADTPGSYTYADLVGRSLTDELVTLECVSNEVGGNLISTANWSGIPLGDLLNAAGPRASADWVAFTCADGYTVGVPLPRASAPSALLALRMNGEPLPSRHGFPARVIVPGLYGMFHAKWVTRITLVQGEFLGFWQQKGWTNRGGIRTTTIIATPAPDTVVRGPVTLGGVAFAGDRGISRVEVSTNGGSTWAPATLRPSLSGRTWVLWTFPWTPTAGGSARILARAVDGLGDPQEPSSSPPFPDGAAGYDSIALLVSL